MRAIRVFLVIVAIVLAVLAVLGSIFAWRNSLYRLKIYEHIVTPQPEQIHLSSTADQSEMMLTWTTMAKPNNSFVEYGLSGKPLTYKNAANTTAYTTCVKAAPRVMFIHRVKLTGLIPSTSYVYRCGGNDGWSALYSFTATKTGADWSPSFVVYGDLGVINAKSLSSLQREIQTGNYDAVLHVGDFAYEMETDNSRLGDAFMNQIEPMAAYVPYMVCPGNHEQHCNFSNYKARFSMPGNNSGLFYSWNIGPVHIVSFSTEVYYFLKYGLDPLINQYNWLKQDLKEANLPHNRAKRPWIITMGHRPMYCSNKVGDNCQHYQNKVRNGITPLHLYPLEKLFYKYGVDLEIWAHEHSYERLFPVYNHKVYNGSYEHPYTNPRAPVHITTGSAGCYACHDKFARDYGPWTAFRTLDYGYTRMKVYNTTHLHLEQVSIDKNNTVIDKVWIIKDKHGLEAWEKGKGTPQTKDKIKMIPSPTPKFLSDLEKTLNNKALQDYAEKMKRYKNAYL